jgi:hypothetical protein
MTNGPPEWMPQPSSPEWIAGRIGTLLDHYFQPDDPAEVSRAQMMDWIRILSTVPQQAISASCEDYLRDQPRKRPTPGEIYNRSNAWLLSKGYAKRPRLGPVDRALPPPERTDADRERAGEILDRAGFTAKRFRAVSARPLAGNAAELDEVTGPRRVPHWTETVAPEDPRFAELRASRAQNKLINPET